MQETRTQAVREEEQRVINNTPILTIPRITDVPNIMQSRNPTAKRALKKTVRPHRRVTRNSTPGIVPVPTLIEPVFPFFPKVRFIEDNPQRRSKWNTIPAKPPQTYMAIPRGAWQRLVTQQAINLLTIQEEVSLDMMYTPQAMMNKCTQVLPTMFEHFARPMVHPIMGETISSYKKLMNDPATAEIRQAAFGKDFAGMVQGNNKMGQKGTNAMFVMTHDKIKQAVAAGKFFTYMNPVVIYRAQKEDPYRIWIKTKGNLINYESNAYVQTADLDTAKIHWKSVVSTPLVRYMCLDIKNFYLKVALEYFEYSQMPLSLFPAWITKQYNMEKHSLNRYIHLEMWQVVWGLPQAGILANKCLRRKLAPVGYFESTNTPGLWYHESRPITITLVVDDFGINYENKDNVDHLIASIKKDYMLTKDWMGNLYCGIQLDWDYAERTVDI